MARLLSGHLVSESFQALRPFWQLEIPINLTKALFKLYYFMAQNLKLISKSVQFMVQRLDFVKFVSLIKTEERLLFERDDGLQHLESAKHQFASQAKGLTLPAHFLRLTCLQKPRVLAERVDEPKHDLSAKRTIVSLRSGLKGFLQFGGHAQVCLNVFRGHAWIIQAKCLHATKHFATFTTKQSAT